MSGFTRVGKSLVFAATRRALRASSRVRSTRAFSSQHPSGTEDYQHPWDIEAFRVNAKATVDWVCDYYAALQQHADAPSSPPFQDTSLSQDASPSHSTYNTTDTSSGVTYTQPSLDSVRSAVEPDQYLLAGWHDVLRSGGEGLGSGADHKQQHHHHHHHHQERAQDTPSSIANDTTGGGGAWDPTTFDYSLPVHGMSGSPQAVAGSLLTQVSRAVVPGLTHWQHPGFMAYFAANSSFPAMMGEMLSSAFNVIGFNWITSPACTELETVVCDWVGMGLGLPDKFRSDAVTGGLGMIQGTASESVLVAVCAARERVRHAIKQGQLPMVYCTEHTHVSVKKALAIAGLDEEVCLCIVPTAHSYNKTHQTSSLGGTGESNFPDYGMSVAALSGILQEHSQGSKVVPMLCVATLGTTSSGACDPIGVAGESTETVTSSTETVSSSTETVTSDSPVTGSEQLVRAVAEGRVGIGALCSEYGVWLHVDAAYAGTALFSPRLRQRYFKHIHPQLRHAQSFNFNAHKWGLTNFDCSVLFVEDKRAVEAALQVGGAPAKPAGDAAVKEGEDSSSDNGCDAIDSHSDTTTVDGQGQSGGAGSSQPSVSTAYLQNRHSDTGDVVDLANLQVPLGRRFRALKLWMVLRVYGYEGIADYLDHHCHLTDQFVEWVDQSQSFSVATAPFCSLVSVRLDLDSAAGPAAQDLSRAERNDATRRVMEAVNARGPFFLTHTELEGEFVIRVAIGSARTQLRHVQAVWEALQEEAGKEMERLRSV